MAVAGGASHELSFDVADASTMADQLVSQIQLYVANVVSGLPPRMHPANLALRLGVELAALTSLGVWGLNVSDKPPLKAISKTLLYIRNFLRKKI